MRCNAGPDNPDNGALQTVGALVSIETLDFKHDCGFPCTAEDRLFSPRVCDISSHGLADVTEQQAATNIQEDVNVIKYELASCLSNASLAYKVDSCRRTLGLRRFRFSHRQKYDLMVVNQHNTAADNADSANEADVLMLPAPSESLSETEVEKSAEAVEAETRIALNHPARLTLTSPMLDAPLASDSEINYSCPSAFPRRYRSPPRRSPPATSGLSRQPGGFTSIMRLSPVKFHPDEQTSNSPTMARAMQAAAKPVAQVQARYSGGLPDGVPLLEQGIVGHDLYATHFVRLVELIVFLVY